MDMDVDVAWCLRCSKRTGDPRRPYCSDQCRLDDLRPPSPGLNSVSLTSAIPPFIASPPLSNPSSGHVSRVKSTTKKPLHRPPLAALPPALRSADFFDQPYGPRDRRAFSFPAPQTLAPGASVKQRQARQSSNVLPPFARKPGTINFNTITSPFLLPTRNHIPAIGADNHAKTTGGAKTPMDVDAVFCSTSESSDNEIPMPVQPRSGPFPVFKPSPPTLLYRQSGSSKSPFSMTQSHLQSHRTSQSPVVPLAASSASSRSREDIISWARAVGVRPGQINGFTSQGEDADTKRGRSRTRRTEALARITPPIDEPLDEHDESHAAAGTTPKGRVASASAGLHIGNSGGGPIVKALTSVTVPNTPSDTKPIGLGLQAVPAATEVSRVDVITSTTPAVGESKGTPATFYNPGATPTLSSISFSEAMDPSIITDNPEHIDVVTDDQQSSSSYFALRRAPCPPQSRQPQPQPQPQIQRQQLPGPLRPIATTASAIWHIGTYLGSFSPFGIPSIVKPYVPKSIAGIPMPSPRDSPSKTFGVPKASPMPAVRADTPTESSVPEIVRSLPLNIIMPEGGKGKKVELSRGREVFDRSRSRSRSDSRSRRRQVSRSPSAIREVDARGRGYAHKWSYDADASDGEGEEPRRGRSRRGKALNREAPRQASDELVTRSPSSSEGRGRGRKRTVRPL